MTCIGSGNHNWKKLKLIIGLKLSDQPVKARSYALHLKESKLLVGKSYLVEKHASKTLLHPPYVLAPNVQFLSNGAI